MTPNLYVIAGHNFHHPGAVGYDGITEHERTLDLQARIMRLIPQVQRLAGSFMLVRTDDQLQSNTMIQNLINRTATPGSLCVDLHFNYGYPTATGTEVVVHPLTPESNKQRATWMVKRIGECLQIPVRKRRSGRMYIYPSETFPGSIGIIEKTRIPAILLEVCFLNRHDLARYKDKEDQVAEIIALGMLR